MDDKADKIAINAKNPTGPDGWFANDPEAERFHKPRKARKSKRERDESEVDCFEALGAR